MFKRSFPSEILTLLVSLPALIGLSRNIGRIVARHHHSIELQPWTRMFFYPGKIQDYTSYIVFIVAAVAVVTIYPLLERKRKFFSAASDEMRRHQRISAVVASFVCLFIPVFIDKAGVSLFIQGVCLGFVFFPEAGLRLTSLGLDRIRRWLEFNNFASVTAAIAVAALALTYVYDPFLRNKFIYPNEYLNIPTIIHVGSRDFDSILELNRLLGPNIAVQDPRRPVEVLANSEVPLQPQNYHLKPESGTIGLNDLVIRRDLEKKFQGTHGEDFLRAVTPTVHTAVQNRYVFHHHIHLLNPVFRFMDGQGLNSIYSHWGKIATLVVGTLQSSIEKFDFSAYMRELFLVKMFYLIVIMAIGWHVFRDHFIFLGFLMLLVASQAGIQIRDLALAGPGVFKDIFDVLSIFLFFLFLRSQSRIWLVATAAGAILSFYNYPLFGVFLSATLSVVLVIRYIQRVKKSYLGDLFLFVVLTGLGIFVCKNAIGNFFGASHSYSLEGFVGAPLRYRELIVLAISYFVSFLAINYLAEQRPGLKYFAMALWLYSAQITLYYVWQPAVAQLLTISGPLILLFATTIKLVFDAIEMPERRKALGFACLVVPGLVMTRSCIRYAEDARDSASIVRASTGVRASGFPALKILTNMDEALFEESAHLIEKHSPGAQIFMISKYENILPIVSRKYSALPYADLQWFLLTDQEIENVKSFFETTRPEVIFTDSDFDQPSLSEVFPRGLPWLGYLQEESFSRSQRLGLLRNLFLDIRPQYELIEAGRLISVYRRK